MDQAKLQDAVKKAAREFANANYAAPSQQEYLLAECAINKGANLALDMILEDRLKVLKINLGH